MVIVERETVHGINILRVHVPPSIAAFLHN